MARKLFGVVAAVALASGAMFALVGPASAGTQGELPHDHHKVVAVSRAPGTVFTVQVTARRRGTTNV